MNKLTRIISADPELVTITWMINNICCNKCTYCIPELNAGEGHMYDWRDAINFLEILLDKHPHTHVAITGGEPTMSEHLIDAVDLVTSRGGYIGFTSNGIASTEYYESITKKIGYVCFSWHPEFQRKNFLEKVKIASQNTFVTVRVMMLPRLWDDCVELYDRLANDEEFSPHALEPVRIVDWGGPEREAHIYTKEQLDWFEQHPARDVRPRNKIVSEKINIVDLGAWAKFQDGDVLDIVGNDFVGKGMTNFRGWKCSVGLKSIFIHQSGDIYRGNCWIGGKIGNIKNPEDIQWPTKPLICTKSLCHCQSDIHLTKWS